MSSKARTYLALAVIGAVVPLALVVAFVASGDAGDWLDLIFGNALTAAIAADVSISSIVFWVWMWPRAQREAGRSPWLFVAANLLVGLSFALPLFLYYRERGAAATA